MRGLQTAIVLAAVGASLVAFAAPIAPTRPIAPVTGAKPPSALGKKVYPGLVAAPPTTKLRFTHGVPIVKVTTLHVDRMVVVNGWCGAASPGALMEMQGSLGEPTGRSLVFLYDDTSKAPVRLTTSVWTKDRIHFTVPGATAFGCTGNSCGVHGSIAIVDANGNPLLAVPNVELAVFGPDMDGDGHRSQSAGGDDCDDCDPHRFPGNTEVPDPEHDEDCDPNTFGCADADNDRWCDARACNRLPNGQLHCGDDCNDQSPSVHPAQVDVCNGIDDNCDGQIDEGLLNCPSTPH